MKKKVGPGNGVADLLLVVAQSQSKNTLTELQLRGDQLKKPP